MEQFSKQCKTWGNFAIGPGVEQPIDSMTRTPFEMRLPRAACVSSSNPARLSREWTALNEIVPVPLIRGKPAIDVEYACGD
jgi:hypothetical protein